MKLTNLPPYELGQVIVPTLPDVILTWLENGDVEINNATEEQVDTLKRAIYVAAGVAYPAQEVYEAKGIARQWFADHPAAVTFVRLTAAQRGTQIDAMSLLQLREVVKFVVEAVVFLIKRELL